MPVDVSPSSGTRSGWFRIRALARAVCILVISSTSIDGSTPPTVRVFVTCAAAATSALPGWSAATVQAPTARKRTSPLSETEQMSGVSVLNCTVSPEEAVAVRATSSPVKKLICAGSGKVMVCDAWAMVRAKAEAVPVKPPVPVEESVAVTRTEAKVPAVVGLPVITPLDEIVSPSGSPVAEKPE